MVHVISHSSKVPEHTAHWPIMMKIISKLFTVVLKIEMRANHKSSLKNEEIS